MALKNEGRTPEAQNQRKFDTKSWLLPSQCGLRGAGKARPRAALSFYLPLSTPYRLDGDGGNNSSNNNNQQFESSDDDNSNTSSSSMPATGQTLLEAPPTSPLATRLALHTLFPLGFPFPAISGLRVC